MTPFEKYQAGILSIEQLIQWIRNDEREQEQKRILVLIEKMINETERIDWQNLNSYKDGKMAVLIALKNQLTEK